MKKLIPILACAALLATHVSAQDPDKQDDEPLFTFVHLTDTHFSASKEKGWWNASGRRLKRALAFIDAEIKPDFVILTGDIITDLSTEEKPPNDLREDLIAVKKLIEDNLDRPCHAVGGNHDWNDFGEVWGKVNYSFDHKGFHFATVGLRYTDKALGWGVFEETEWLDKDLRDHKNRPAIIFTHNPINFPTFQNAADVKKLLESHENVFLVLQGHVHMSMRGEAEGITYYTGPMFQRKPFPFKIFKVHKNRLELGTARIVKAGENGETYRVGKKWMEIRIPDRVRELLKEKEKK